MSACCRAKKKGKMTLSYRARALGSADKGVPADDVLRLVHPARHLQVLKSAFDAYSSQAANDGLEFVNMLPLKSPDVVCPAAAWRREAHRGQKGSKMTSERGAGALQEIAEVMENARTVCRRAVFVCRLFAFNFQKRFLRAAHKLCDALVPL